MTTFSYLELEWDGEDADDDVGEGQVGDEEVGDGTHPAIANHHVYHQSVAWGEKVNNKFNLK